MLERLIGYFMEHPTRMVTLGISVFRVSAAVLLAGVLANLVSTTMGSLRSFSGVRTAPTLADFLPGIPTLWVPESFPAFFLYAAVALIGLIVAHEGRRYERFLRNY